jgi:hypothetical protein
MLLTVVVARLQRHFSVMEPPGNDQFSGAIEPHSNSTLGAFDMTRSFRAGLNVVQAGFLVLVME